MPSWHWLLRATSELVSNTIRPLFHAEYCAEMGIGRVRVVK